MFVKGAECVTVASQVEHCGFVSSLILGVYIFGK